MYNRLQLEALRRAEHHGGSAGPDVCSAAANSATVTPCSAVLCWQICDVGLATVLNDRSRRASFPNFTFSYAAPELLLGEDLSLKVASRHALPPVHITPGGYDAYCIRQGSWQLHVQSRATPSYCEPVTRVWQLCRRISFRWVYCSRR